MTSHAIARRTLINPALMARAAGRGEMCPSQCEGAVIEARTGPTVGRMALLASRREARRNVIGIASGVVIIEVARRASRRSTLVNAVPMTSGAVLIRVAPD